MRHARVSSLEYRLPRVLASTAPDDVGMDDVLAWGEEAHEPRSLPEREELSAHLALSPGNDHQKVGHERFAVHQTSGSFWRDTPIQAD
jgi:hypothetical protein